MTFYSIEFKWSGGSLYRWQRISTPYFDKDKAFADMTYQMKNGPVYTEERGDFRIVEYELDDDIAEDIMASGDYGHLTSKEPNLMFVNHLHPRGWE